MNISQGGKQMIPFLLEYKFLCRFGKKIVLYHVEDESSVRDRPLKRYSSVHEWILVGNLCGDPHGYSVTRFT